jgi:hypothetical protein
MGPAASGEPVMMLRGASVSADARRVGIAVTSLLLVGLVVLVAVLFGAGVDKNDQIDRLRGSGAAVDITITGCQGLLGGSGSNAAGYACRGSFNLEGRRFDEAIPGNTLYYPGARLAGVAVPGDPSLVVPDTILADEHASSGVFVVPSVLLLALLVLAGGLALWRLRFRPECLSAPRRPRTAYRLRDAAGGV